MDTIADADTSNDVDNTVKIDRLNLPSIDYLNRDVFQFEGKKYLAHPSVEELLLEVGITNVRIYRSIIRELHLQGITTIDEMLNINKYNLLQLESVDALIVSKIFNHLIKIKHKGSIILRSDDLEKLEKEYYYLEFEKNIDTILFKYSNGQTGLRSKSIVELCGDEDVGKTQWCMKATCSMLQVGRKVAYIDSEGGFDFNRIQHIAEESNLSQRPIKDNIVLAQIDSFDELDVTLDQLSTILKSENIGMIIIDSIMQLLQNTYPVERDLSNLNQRQLHLRKTMRRLRQLARFHNLIIIYTNHTREAKYFVSQNLNEDLISEDLSDQEDEMKMIINLLKKLVLVQVPMGGRTLAHSSDMRIFLSRNRDRSADEEVINQYTARMENCSYLPSVSVEYVISPEGIRVSDTTGIDRSTEHRKKLNDLLG